VKTVCVPIFALTVSLFSVRAFAQGQGPQTANPSLPKSVRVVEAATPLRAGPGVTYPIVVTEAAGTVLEVTGRDGDWYRITLSADMVVDPSAPRTVYVLARLVSPVMGSTTTPQGIPPSQPPSPPQPPAVVTQRNQEPPMTPVATEPLQAMPLSRAVTSDGSLGWCVFDDGGSANPACVTASGVWWLKPWVGPVFESTYVHLTRSNGFPISVGLLVTDAGVRFGVNMGAHARLVYEIVVGSGWARTEGVNEFGLALKPALGVEIDLSKTHAAAIRPQLESVNVRVAGLWVHDEAFSVDIVWRSFRVR
jgi:hypothetical protein